MRKTIVFIATPVIASLFACSAPPERWISPNARTLRPTDTLFIVMPKGATFKNFSDMSDDYGANDTAAAQVVMDKLLTSAFNQSSFATVIVERNVEGQTLARSAYAEGKSTGFELFTPKDSARGHITISLNLLTSSRQSQTSTMGSGNFRTFTTRNWLDIKSNYQIFDANGVLVAFGRTNGESTYNFIIDTSDWLKSTTRFSENVLWGTGLNRTSTTPPTNLAETYGPCNLDSLRKHNSTRLYW